MSQTGMVSWSPTASNNATADSNVNFSEGMAPGQVNDSARALMASGAKFVADTNGSLVTGGTTTAYTVSTNQGFASLSAMSGHHIKIRFNATCGSSPTLNVDSLGGKAIQIDASTAVAKGSLRKDGIHDATYDNSIPAWIVHNGHSLVAPGRISETANSTADPGWLLCDGTSYPTATYPDLFANIGYTFGGSGANFNVPNRKGRVAYGVDASASVITGATTLGAVQGEQNHTLSSSEMPAHSHGVTDPGHSHSLSDGGQVLTDAADTSGTHSVDAGGVLGKATIVSNTTGISIQNSGSGGGHNNLQPSIAMNFQIKI